MGVAEIPGLGPGELRHPATGLMTAELFDEVSRPLIALAKRYGRHAAVLVIDQGGPAFDAAQLEHIGGYLLSLVRTSDVVGLLDPGRVAVLLSDLWEEETAGRVAVRLLSRLQEKSEGTPLRAGLAVYPEDGHTIEELIDRGLLACRRLPAGTSGISSYRSELTDSVEQQLRLVSEMGRARSGEFTLAYQPIRSVATGELVGAEGLARWTHPQRGNLRAADFIPLAERTGRVLSIDQWAIDAAAAQAVRWQKIGWSGWVSVNLSGRSVSNPDVLAWVGKTMDAHGLAPGSMAIEITETAVLKNPRETEASLSELREMGVYVALDDFGVGYSAFAYLQSLKVDFLKLDHSYVRDAPNNDRQSRLAEGLVRLAQHLGIPVVAEGVETEAQLEWLRGIDCDWMQGYHVGEPRGAEHLTWGSSGRNGG